MSHATRPRLRRSHPVHITMKWRRGMPTLRSRSARRILEASFRIANTRPGFQIAHFSIQSNHVHLICEAEDAPAVSRVMQGLAIRVAKRLNKLWGRVGPVFADRYHRRDLTGPRQVRNALRYVLLNVLRHAPRRQAGLARRPDPYSSGAWFTGWLEGLAGHGPGLSASTPVAPPRTWLLREGWTRHGLISLTEQPAAP